MRRCWVRGATRFADFRSIPTASFFPATRWVATPPGILAWRSLSAAGVIPIVATAGKFVNLYWPNAEKLSFYFVSGELDGNKTVTNAPQWERYFSRRQAGI